jgi:hypothetical protein
VAGKQSRLLKGLFQWGKREPFLNSKDLFPQENPFLMERKNSEHLAVKCCFLH